jgi:hypothetical protein
MHRRAAFAIDIMPPLIALRAFISDDYLASAG